MRNFKRASSNLSPVLLLILLLLLDLLLLLVLLFSLLQSVEQQGLLSEFGVEFLLLLLLSVVFCCSLLLWVCWVGLSWAGRLTVRLYLLRMLSMLSSWKVAEGIEGGWDEWDGKLMVGWRDEWEEMLMDGWMGGEMKEGAKEPKEVSFS